MKTWSAQADTPMVLIHDLRSAKGEELDVATLEAAL